MKKIISVILVVMLAFCFATTANAEDGIVDSGYCGAGTGGTNLSWSLDTDGVLTISGTGAMASFTEGSAHWYEYRGDIRSLVIKEGVTSIGDYAFYLLSNLGKIKLPSSLEVIGNRAFDKCSYITGSLVIPENVRTIGHYAFYNCKRIDGALVLPEKLESIGAGAFQNCTSLIGAVVFPESLESIGHSAFYNCSINDYFFKGMIPEDVIGAGESSPSFDANSDTLHCSASNVITDGTWLGYKADYVGPDDVIDSGDCGAPGYEPDVRWVFTASGKLVIIGAGKMADYESVYHQTLEYYGWGSSAPWIKYQKKITSIEIEDGINHIGDYAFYPLTYATGKLDIPDSVFTIGDFAFNGLNNVYGEFDFPKYVTSIGEYAFGYCYGLTGDLVVPDTLTTIEKGVFSGCNGLEGNLVIPEGITSIGRYAFSGCYRLTGDLVIPDSVVTIGEYAFESCRAFDGTLTIGSGVETIEGNAFNDCSGLTGSIVIPESVTTIGDSAFSYCSGFTGDLTIPDNVTELGFSVFEYCEGLDGNLTLGKGLTEIKDHTFSGCTNLDKIVVIPKKISYIAQGAFANCGIDEFYFKGNAPDGVHAASGDTTYDTFEEDKDIIYYPIGNTTWVIEDGKWMGYIVAGWEYVEETVYGDVNGDGKINIADANLARRASAKLVSLDDSQFAAADVNGDEKVNIADANLIRRYAAKLIKTFPIEG